MIKTSIDRCGNSEVKIVLDEKEALKEALDNAEKGDCIIVFYEKLKPLIKIIENYKNFKYNENLANL